MSRSTQKVAINQGQQDWSSQTRAGAFDGAKAGLAKEIARATRNKRLWTAWIWMWSATPKTWKNWRVEAEISRRWWGTWARRTRSSCTERPRNPNASNNSWPQWVRNFERRSRRRQISMQRWCRSFTSARRKSNVPRTRILKQSSLVQRWRMLKRTTPSEAGDHEIERADLWRATEGTKCWQSGAEDQGIERTTDEDYDYDSLTVLVGKDEGRFYKVQRKAKAAKQLLEKEEKKAAQQEQAAEKEMGIEKKKAAEKEKENSLKLVKWYDSWMKRERKHRRPSTNRWNWCEKDMPKRFRSKRRTSRSRWSKSREESRKRCANLKRSFCKSKMLPKSRPLWQKRRKSSCDRNWSRPSRRRNKILISSVRPQPKRWKWPRWSCKICNMR